MKGIFGDSFYATPNGVENERIPLPRVERCAFNPGLCDDTLFEGIQNAHFVRLKEIILK